MIVKISMQARASQSLVTLSASIHKTTHTETLKIHTIRDRCLQIIVGKGEISRLENLPIPTMLSR